MSPDRPRCSSIGVDRVFEWNGCEAEANALAGARSRVSLRDAGTASDAVTHARLAKMLPRREGATLGVPRDAGVTGKRGNDGARDIAARGSMNKKGVTENSVTPFRIWCRLQDSNPPPDDYKALEIFMHYKYLANFRVSKTGNCIGLSALSGKAQHWIGNAARSN
ncbi:hypothetical protein ACGTRS_32920 [Burkholderia semiarida]|uniref:Uncharacterized protein n=1 Tax=Burkholderia semiarida TaxID=2843303 RepID=A0ABW7LDA0_9BURK